MHLHSLASYYLKSKGHDPKRCTFTYQEDGKTVKVYVNTAVDMSLDSDDHIWEDVDVVLTWDPEKGTLEEGRFLNEDGEPGYFPEKALTPSEIVPPDVKEHYKSKGFNYHHIAIAIQDPYKIPTSREALFAAYEYMLKQEWRISVHSADGQFSHFDFWAVPDDEYIWKVRVFDSHWHWDFFPYNDLGECAVGIVLVYDKKTNTITEHRHPKPFLEPTDQGPWELTPEDIKNLPPEDMEAYLAEIDGTEH